ncbi:MAG: MarR family transcriptional regulator [Erysipelotrichaceae bacterium]|nr:MarR family transcriptional regulator [Erysipelotrichaceae bacterium]
MKKINEELMKEFILASRFVSKPHGRPMGQERILRKLAEGPVNQKDLQEELFVRPGSISEIVSKLEEKGLLSRNKTADDARAVSLELTEKGRERLNALEEEMDLFSSITDEEKETLKDILTRLNNDWIRRGPVSLREGRPERCPDEFRHHGPCHRHMDGPHEFPERGECPHHEGRQFGERRCHHKGPEGPEDD